MAYVVDPTDPTHPTDLDPAEQGQAELRALKAYLQAVLPIGSSGMNFFRKNRVINGDCAIDQRHEGASGGACSQTANYVVDHFVAYAPAASTVTCQRTGNIAGSQPSFYATLNVTATSAALAAEKFGFETAIEGLDVSDLQWGTANAKSISLSFAIVSPVTGTHCVALKNLAGTRSYVATFQVPVANVVTLISLNNIPGCVDGVWPTDNTMGLDIFFDAGCGVNFEAAVANAWSNGNFNRVAGAANGGSVNGSTFKVSYVQLERANAASEFEQRNFIERLARAQRYYEKSFKAGDVPANATVGITYADNVVTMIVNASVLCPNYFWAEFKVTKRVSPTVTIFNPRVGGGSNVPADATVNLDMNTVTITAGTNRIKILAQDNVAGVAQGNLGVLGYTANADFW